MMKNIVVFAGNECLQEKEQYYYPLAYTTGQLLAKAGFTVVTGGGPGLMNEVCRGAYEAGGETIGICLNVEGREQSSFLTKKEVFDHLNPRQERLLFFGDGYLALPGGIGSLYEITAVIALKRKKDIPVQRPLIIIDEYYQELRFLMEKMEREGFINHELDTSYEFAKTPQEAVGILIKKMP